MNKSCKYEADVICKLFDILDNHSAEYTNMLSWGAPVISFGDYSTSQVATLGLNPSNREFVDEAGKELIETNRRFPTLNSLNLRRWSDADTSDIDKVIYACKSYFKNNPYDTWFKSLDRLITDTSHSYYHSLFEACHLDLVPIATNIKWGELPPKEINFLLDKTRFTLGNVVKESTISVLILNGQSVVTHLEAISDVKLKKNESIDWLLPRKIGLGVKGYAYKGRVCEIGGIDLGREILILGYNHNIQSSFGVTSKVKSSIQHWIGNEVLKYGL